MSGFHDLSEAQSKLIFGRINHVERNISLINGSLEGMMKKENKFCNKIDEISNKFKYISESETYDESLGKMFEHMSSTMVHLADIKATKIARIEEKLLGDLMQCDLICRNTRDEAKNLIALRDFELHKRSQINLNKKAKKNVLTENEAMLSNIQISKVLKELLSMAEKFESQKFSDFKQFFLNFILIQMKYFATGIEILTTTYEDIANINGHSEQFIVEMKSYNRQFKKHIEQDSLQGYKLPFMRALSRFSHSTSNVDMIGKHENFLKKTNVGKTQSTMSLNTLDVFKKADDNQRRKNIPADLSIVEKVSDSDETDVDDSSDMEPTDTENIQNKPQGFVNN